MQQPGVGDQQVAGSQRHVQGIGVVGEGWMGQVLQGLQLLAMGIGQEIVQPMAGAVTARYDAQTAVLPRGVDQVVGEEDPGRPGSGRPRAVPLHEVLVPVERRSVGGLGEDDDHLVRSEVLQPDLPAHCPLRRQVDRPRRHRVGEALRVVLGLLPPLRRHGRPAAFGVYEQVAALVADLVAYVRAGEDAVRPGAQLFQQLRRHHVRNRGVAALHQLLSLGQGVSRGQDHRAHPIVSAMIPHAPSRR